MKISSCSDISFKNNFKIAYDDDMSRQAREVMRKNLEKGLISDEFFKNENTMSDENLNFMLSNMVKKPYKTDISQILLMSSNVKKIAGTKNSYRGPTLAYNSKCLKTLKNNGVERVIDLWGYNVYKKRCENNSLEYYYFPFTGVQKALGCTLTDFFSDNAEALIASFENEDSGDFREFTLSEYHKYRRKNIREITAFIVEMQKDNLYIGCNLGTYLTDDALVLNNCLNPQAKGDIQFYNPSLYKMMKNLYFDLTDYDKKIMGWDETFDKNYLQKIEKAKPFFLA